MEDSSKFELLSYEIFAEPKYTKSYKTNDNRMINDYFLVNNKQGVFLKHLKANAI